MAERVIPYALGAGADYYVAPEAPSSMWVENNRVWINQKMDLKYRIIDIGPMRTRANFPLPTSPFYQMELNEIESRNYPTYKVDVP